MKTIKEQLDNVNEERMINESLMEPHLRDLAKQLRKGGYGYHIPNSFNSLMGRFWNIQWDKMNSSVVKEHPANSSTISKIKKMRCFVLGMKDGKYVFCFTPNGDYQSLTDNNDFSAIRGESFTSRTKRFIPLCDKVVIIDIEDYSASDLVRQRSDERSGMIFRYDDELNRTGKIEDYLENLAKSNIDRYKKMIAKAHTEKDDNFEAINARVSDLLQRALALATQVSSGKKEIEGSMWEISLLLEKFYSQRRYDRGQSIGNDGLLKLISEYLRNKESLRQGSSYDAQGTEKLNKMILDKITTACDAIESTLKKYE